MHTSKPHVLPGLLPSCDATVVVAEAAGTCVATTGSQTAVSRFGCVPAGQRQMPSMHCEPPMQTSSGPVTRANVLMWNYESHQLAAGHIFGGGGRAGTEQTK
jgi:hypothetical protein